MTNKELAEYCSENEISVESKNVSKPTKTEYLNAIYENEGDILGDELIDPITLADDVESFLDVSDTENEVQNNSKKEKQLTRSEKRRLKWKELMPLRRVIINSNDNSQTKIKNQVEFATWGNRLIGHHTDRFVLGRPWHVREGALRNLRNMKISRSIQDEDGNTVRFETVPAYIIQELEPLSKNEIELIAKRQVIRESSIEQTI